MPLDGYHLAQANYSLWKADVSADAVQRFVERLEEINALAENCRGFVWRYISGPEDPQVIRVFENQRAIFNMSLWTSVEALKSFAFRGEHAGIMKRRAEWFERIADATSVLWWVPAGYRPDVSEARQKLDLLKRNGPTAAAFNFASVYPGE